MREKFLELRINRDFGDILTTYFEFLKQNIKKFTNVFFELQWGILGRVY